MLTRLVVFAGLLLVFSLNSGDGFAAVIDNYNADSPNVNVIWDRDDNGNIAYDDMTVGLQNIFDDKISLDAYNRDEDSRYDGNLNAGDNLGNDDEPLVGEENQYDPYDPPSPNFYDDYINYEMNL